MSLPLSSLLGIFNNEKRNLSDHDTAYELIKAHFELTGDAKIFELLPSLDGSLLSRANVRDAIFNKDSRGGFLPQIDNTTLLEIVDFEREISESASHFEKLVKDQQSEIDMLMIELDLMNDFESHDLEDLMNLVTAQEK